MLKMKRKVKKIFAPYSLQTTWRNENVLEKLPSLKTLVYTEIVFERTLGVIERVFAEENAPRGASQGTTLRPERNSSGIKVTELSLSLSLSRRLLEMIRAALFRLLGLIREGTRDSNGSAIIFKALHRSNVEQTSKDRFFFSLSLSPFDRFVSNARKPL